MLIIIFFATAAAKYIVSISIHSKPLKPRLLGAMGWRTRGHDFELPTIKYEFNKQNFIVRLLFNYVWPCIFCICFIFILIALYTCVNVIMYQTLTDWLTYLLTYTCNLYLHKSKYRSRYQDSIGSLDLKTKPPCIKWTRSIRHIRPT